MRAAIAALLLLVAWPPARAEVLCVRAKKNGTLSGAIKVRSACKKREVQVDGAMLGLCCDASTTTSTAAVGTTFTTVTTTMTSLTTLTTTVTTSTSTSLVCPTFTTSTLGVNDCGGSPPTCFGLCSNARQCHDDGVACSCTGDPLPCGVVRADGTCGGTCPDSTVCITTEVLGTDGCPTGLTCGCVAP